MRSGVNFHYASETQMIYLANESKPEELYLQARQNVANHKGELRHISICDGVMLE